MRTAYLLIIVFFLSEKCFAQEAQVVVFKHELRWTDETKFPNYFLMPEIRDSVFNKTRLELMNYLKVPDVKFPAEVEYNIMNGFGKQKTEMPQNISGNAPEIGIFSFITRATSGFAMFWNLTMIIKQNNKIIFQKEVSHELEYFNPSGYLTSQLWIKPEEFQEIFTRLVKETLGVLSATNEKIVLGSFEAEENKARSLLPGAMRHLLKMNGAWESGENFSARLQTENDTLMDFYFKDGFSLSIATPTLTGVMGTLFSEVMGVDLLYQQKVRKQINSTMYFSDDQKVMIKMSWIDVETHTFLFDNVTTRVSGPMVAELYDNHQQTGYFLFTYQEKVKETAKTSEKFNAFSGMQKSNTLGIERIQRIEGAISGKPVSAEFNEGEGIIRIKSGAEMLGVMVVQNCNPENQKINNTNLSKNKRFVTSTSQSVAKPSMKNEKKTEWYPLFLPGDVTDDSRKMAIEALVCLFFGMGNMN